LQGILKLSPCGESVCRVAWTNKNNSAGSINGRIRMWWIWVC